MVGLGVSTSAAAESKASERIHHLRKAHMDFDDVGYGERGDEPYTEDK